jgi:predicted RecB family nuclease
VARGDNRFAMHLLDGVVTLSPTDLVGFLDCAHLTQLELAVTRGTLERPVRHDPELELLSRLGEAHELTHLMRLQSSVGGVIVISDHPESLDGLRAAEAETLGAMRRGAGVIYQAAFFDGRWRGRADFLLRVEIPSDLGGWSYEVADTKLARSVKVAALLQMCEYSLHVERLQGLAPEHMHVILGDGTQERQAVAEYAAYHRAARRRLEEAVAGVAMLSSPDPVDHCHVCRWDDRCTAQRRADDHLSLVAGMRRDQTRRLVAAGITTVAELAAAADAPVADVGEAPWTRLRRQARLQVEERTTRRQTWDLVPLDEPGLGLAALPSPSAGDLFFDMEGDPFVEGGGLEYLFGVTEVVDGAPFFQGFWAHDRAAEKAAFEDFVDLVIDRLDRDPDLHVYHYAPYEPTALKKLMGRHATREQEVDRLLRGGVLVDLYQVVRQGVCVSKESYSLKSLEAYYMPRRAEAIADAASSIVAYEDWLRTGEAKLLTDIERYNERDCESTRLLRGWLEARRTELELRIGGVIPRPERRSGAAPEKLAEVSAEIRELVDRLTLGVPDDAAERTAAGSTRWLLAQLLDWHRREDKASWWAYYARCALTDDELVEDAESIGALAYDGVVGRVGRSVVHRYRFDPAQEHKLDPGDSPHDPRTTKQAGEVTLLDNDAGVVELRRGPSLAEVAQPTSLIPGPPIPTTSMREALQRVASWVIENAIDAPGRYQALRDLLAGRPPRVRNRAQGIALIGPDADPVSATCDLVIDLDASCLAVQGPPGCGKTHTGAHVIVELVRRGRRVGVSATTHRAIANLLEKTAQTAADRGQLVRMMQKCDADQVCAAPGIHRIEDNGGIAAALLADEVDVVAGTPWLFADERLDGLLDVVVIDEAGQMSLANACAVGTAAQSLVLLGDPQQLAQPSQGIHPPGAERSALEHLLDGHDTIAPERGVFLPTTWRMHPDICEFVSTAFYEGRLTADPSCARRRIDGGGDLAGTGNRLAAVPHRGNRTWSSEEVDAVRALVEQLLTATWVADDEVRPLRLGDILVVAPYNAQVKRLRDALPGGIRVGTVDKFQGQQAAVSIYSMATSSAEDVPRNLEFLFSRNRLNVGVSRAQGLSIVVCSPQLMAAPCRNPAQLRLVNALCRYAEMATPVGGAALAV